MKYEYHNMPGKVDGALDSVFRKKLGTRAQENQRTSEDKSAGLVENYLYRVR